MLSHFGPVRGKSEDVCANTLFMTEREREGREGWGVSGFRHYKQDNPSDKHTKGTEHTHAAPLDVCY